MLVDVLQWKNEFLSQAPMTDVKEFILTRKLTPLTMDFFEADSPLFGNHHDEKMCWHIKISDNSRKCAVKVWDKPVLRIVPGDRIRPSCYMGRRTPRSGQAGRYSQEVEPSF